MQKSVLSQSLSSLYCRTCMGDQRRLFSGLFNRYNNIMNYYPSSGNSRTCPPSWGRALILTREVDSPSRIIRRFPPAGGLLMLVAVISYLRMSSHPGCLKGNVSLKSGQRVAVCPGRPHEKQINPVMFRRCCRSRGGCRCRGRRPSHNDSNVCSGLFGTDSLNICCNRSSIS